MKGLPIVAVGTHVGPELVMFGVCESVAWLALERPNPRYHSKIEVRWEHYAYQVDPANRPTRPGLSNSRLTKVQYDAWRQVAVPVLDLRA
jgi:hypothetical protein